MSAGECERAAAAIHDCRRELATRGSTTIREAMKCRSDDAGEPVPWQRYPEGEAYDPQTHAQYFFHCHPPATGPQSAATGDDLGGLAEHGHFHLFLRAEGMPRGVAPLLFPEHALSSASTPPQAAPTRRGGSDRVAHLLAIAVDGKGEPVRLFTTNRWVTGETWYPAADLARMLDRFAPGGRAPVSLLDRWLGALVRLYRREIEDMLERRDKAVAKWRWLWPRRNALDDPRFEVTAQCPVDLDARLSTFEPRIAASRIIGAAGRHTVVPPNMSEGWGV